MMKNLSQTGSSHSPQPIRVGSRRALLAADHRGRVWEPSEGSHISGCGWRRASQPSNTSLTAARASTASAAIGDPASGTNATPSGKRTRDSRSGRFSLGLVYPRCRRRASPAPAIEALGSRVNPPVDDRCVSRYKALPAIPALALSRGEPAGFAGGGPSREGMGTLSEFPCQIGWV